MATHPGATALSISSEVRKWRGKRENPFTLHRSGLDPPLPPPQSRIKSKDGEPANCLRELAGCPQLDAHWLSQSSTKLVRSLKEAPCVTVSQTVRCSQPASQIKLKRRTAEFLVCPDHEGYGNYSCSETASGCHVPLCYSYPVVFQKGFQNKRSSKGVGQHPAQMESSLLCIQHPSSSLHKFASVPSADQRYRYEVMGENHKHPWTPGDRETGMAGPCFKSRHS